MRLMLGAAGRRSGVTIAGAARSGTHFLRTTPARPGGPGEQEDGAERAMKPGVNSPANAAQLASEAKTAAKGLAESVEQSVKAIGYKVKDYMAAAGRAGGMQTDRTPPSGDELHGAAGKMQHAPSGSLDGGASVDATHARAKYDEIADAEKRHYPSGERSVNDLFPDMAAAAKAQSSGEGQQRATNAAIVEELRGGSGRGGGGEAVRQEREREQELQSNLHDKGP